MLYTMRIAKSLLLISRRNLLKRCCNGLVALAAFFWAGARWAYAKKLGFKLSQAPALETVGGSQVLMLKNTKVLLIRHSEDAIIALSPTCSHKKCDVRYVAKNKNIACKCHKSAFSVEGKVLSGPATKPLTRYPAQLNAQKQTVVVTLPNT
jgi:Rieske Fe-S protein